MASHPPRTNPYSLSASTAYWLQVGLNRHVGNRIGEMVWRYSSMRKITPRTTAEPLRPISAEEPTEVISSTPHRAVGFGVMPSAILAPAGLRSRADCSGAPGSPPGPQDPARRSPSARRVAAGGPPDAAAPRCQQISRPPIRCEVRRRGCRRKTATHAPRGRAAPPAPLESRWHRIPSIASSGTAPEAPR